MSTQNIYLRTFPPNSFIFNEGAQSTEVYLIRSGRVEITKRGKTEDIMLKTMGPKEIFGEMALISNKGRSASAKALIETECYVLSAKAFDEKLEAMDPFLRGIFRILSNTIREITEENGQLRLDMAKLEAAAKKAATAATDNAEKPESNT